MLDTKQKLHGENTVRILLHYADRVTGTSLSQPSFNMTRFLDVVRSTFDMSRPVYFFVDRFMNAGANSGGVPVAMIWNEMPISPNNMATNPNFARCIVLHPGNNTNTATTTLNPSNNMLSSIEIDPQTLVGMSTWSFRFLLATNGAQCTDAQAGTSFFLGITLFQKPTDSHAVARV